MTIYDLLEEKKNAQETVSAVALWFIYYVYSEVVPREVHEEIVTIVTELWEKNDEGGWSWLRMIILIGG